MKITTTLTAVLAVILATGQVACKVDTGIDDLADVLGDAIDDDDNCRVAMRQNKNNGNGRGDPHDDDDEETVEETNEETTETEDSDPCSVVTNDDGEAVEYGDATPVDGDTSGGIMIPDETEGELESRVSLGTWRLNSYSTCQQDFIYSADRHDAPPIPDNVRIYSNIFSDDYQTLDFQNTTGSLVTIATVYPDDTFDFMMRFLDQFGAPSETLNCTCQIIEAYYNYSSDQIDCLCNPSQTANDCTVKYDKI